MKKYSVHIVKYELGNPDNRTHFEFASLESALDVVNAIAKSYEGKFSFSVTLENC